MFSEWYILRDMRTLNTRTQPMYNLRSAAKALGKSPSTIAYWLEKGELAEVPSLGRSRMITAASVQAKAREIGVKLEGEAA